VIKGDDGMTLPQQSSGRPALPLSDLFTRYLQRQVSAHAQGLGYPEPADEVVPHEAVPVQPVDPQRAWDDALAVLGHFPAATKARPADVPPDWPALVGTQEPAVSLAFCLGNFPQLVRTLHPLLGGDLTALRGTPVRPLSSPGLEDWAARSQGYPQALVAVGVLRLARHFDEAGRLLGRSEAPSAWRALRANEEAALAWHAGRGDEALALWQAQEPAVPVLFNRGMAALFLGQAAAAQPALARAVEALPETSPWHHLGHLYLALASSRV
jgi:tetratricopeptide (TPR) repeat protein